MILGSSVRNHIRSFGFSLSGGVDLDSNEYDLNDDENNDHNDEYDDHSDEYELRRRSLVESASAPNSHKVQLSKN